MALTSSLRVPVPFRPLFPLQISILLAPLSTNLSGWYLPPNPVALYPCTPWQGPPTLALPNLKIQTFLSTSTAAQTFNLLLYRKFGRMIRKSQSYVATTLSEQTTHYRYSSFQGPSYLEYKVPPPPLPHYLFCPLSPPFQGSCPLPLILPLSSPRLSHCLLPCPLSCLALPLSLPLLSHCLLPCL